MDLNTYRFQSEDENEEAHAFSRRNDALARFAKSGLASHLDTVTFLPFMTVVSKVFVGICQDAQDNTGGSYARPMRYLACNVSSTVHRNAP